MWKFEFQELATRLPEVVDKTVVIIRLFTQDAVSRLRTVSLYQSTYHMQVAARADTSFATEGTQFTRRLGSSGSKVTVPGSDTHHHKTVAAEWCSDIGNDGNGGVRAQLRALHLTDTHTHMPPKTIKNN